MKTEILDLPKEFEYIPEVINSEKLDSCDSYVIGGMGGSGLVVGILRALKPELDIAAHHEYGLPNYLKDDKQKRLFIAVSVSGNTEETINFLEEAIKNKLQVAAISKGGKLLEIAEENNIPFIKLPETNTEPRMSLGYMLRASTKLISEEKLFNEIEKLSSILKPEELERDGKSIADSQKERWPIIYSSKRNQTIAYNWKIKINETGKRPAFYNTFPELNHNEMQGFGDDESPYTLFIFIRDEEDDKRIIKRMDIMKEMFENRGFKIIKHIVSGDSRAERIFKSLTIANWTAYHTAINNGFKPEGQPLIDEFKKKIA